MASTYLSRTPSSAGNRRTFTISVWFKRTALETFNYIFDCDGGSTQSENQLGLYEDRIGFGVWNTSTSSSAIIVRTNRKLRDTNAWYHIVCAVDTTQATASDRVKLYLNGELQTDLSSTTYPSQNYETAINSTVPHAIGRWEDGGSRYFNGLMSHFHFCDGQALAPTVFGSTDSATGEWKINTSPTFTPGTNGFTVLKDGITVTDQSANSNNWSVGGGTLTKTEDCPSNVFCTMNPLNSVYISFLQGNNTISGGNNGSDYSYIGSTLAANSGKFYWEVKAADLAEIDQVGVALASGVFSGIGLGGGLQNNFGGKSVQFSNGNKAGDSAQSGYMGGFSTDDIMMIALDLDNNKITFGRNGQWANGSGGADQTYANSTAAFTNLTAGEYYMPAHAMRGYGGNTGISRYNFGNGYFATTAISSAGTNASNNGLFEYDVPSGFTALSTKGLNL